MYPLEVVANGRRQLFDAGTTVVCGRSPDAQVLLSDRRVGRVHATLTFEGEAWLVRDGDSRNGTWVEGRRIEQQRIDHRTTLHLGNPTDGAFVLLIPRPDAAMAAGQVPAPSGQLPAPSGQVPVPSGQLPAPGTPVPANERTGLRSDEATPVLVVRLDSGATVRVVAGDVRLRLAAEM